MADIPKDIREYTENRAKRYDAPFSFPESNKYNVNQHTYPSGVGKSPDLQHYVAFFVNVRGKSKFIDSYQTNDVIVSKGRRDNYDLSVSGEGTAAKFITVAAGVGGLGAVKGAIDGATSRGSMAQKGAETVKQGLAGGAKGTAVSGAVLSTVITATTLSKTLKANYKNRTSIVHAVLADRIGKRDPGNKPDINERVPFVYIIPSGKVTLQGDWSGH